MTIDAEFIRKLKLYCHIDEDRPDEDALLEVFIPSAVSELKSSGITEQSVDPDKYLTMLFAEILSLRDKTDRDKGTQQKVNVAKIAPDYVER